MKKLIFSAFAGLIIIAFTGCSGSEHDAATKTKKCQSGLCGGGKCTHGKKFEIKKAGTAEANRSAKSK